jgi:hypothetical protein
MLARLPLPLPLTVVIDSLELPLIRIAFSKFKLQRTGT